MKVAFNHSFWHTIYTFFQSFFAKLRDKARCKIRLNYYIRPSNESHVTWMHDDSNRFVGKLRSAHIFWHLNEDEVVEYDSAEFPSKMLKKLWILTIFDTATVVWTFSYAKEQQTRLAAFLFHRVIHWHIAFCQCHRFSILSNLRCTHS